MGDLSLRTANALLAVKQYPCGLAALSFFIADIERFLV
jgi:hypothetical protein